MRPGRGRGRRAAQGVGSGLRAVEGAQGGRGHRLAVALGRRAAGLAHRVLARWPRRSSGVDFDVHGGGSDLVFPHHENEIAQTEAARGKPLARIWMHNGMVQLDEEKMSKSVGNIRSLSGALDEHGRDALIMYFAGGHYRQPLAFSRGRRWRRPRRSVERIRDLIRRLDPGRDCPGGHGRVRGALLRRPGGRLPDPRRARGAVRMGVRGEPAPRFR